MAKKNLPRPLSVRTGERALMPMTSKLQKNSNIPRLWLWFGLLLVVGIILIIVFSNVVLGWLKFLQAPLTVKTTPITVTTYQVNRTGAYAGLQLTILSAEYATSFADDTIHSDQAVLRLNMSVANKSDYQVQIVYYDSAHLLIPKQDPIRPTNVQLSAGPAPGKTETGWIDFSVKQGLQLSTLQLQLGSVANGESLVVIPFSGAYDANRYADRTSSQNGNFVYNYYGHLLDYHLTSIDIRFSYNGVQTRGGQQIYVLNFKVDNNEGVDVSPGFGFDYMRLNVNGSERTPIDSTPPSAFKAGSKGVEGHVVFYGPPGMTNFSLGFLAQNGNPEQFFDVKI